MKIEKIKIKDLKEYELNAKRHPEEQIEGLMQSIKTFGFVQPVVIDAKNEIIIGHGRTKAAHRLGMDELPCVRVEGLTEAQIRTLRLIDNRIAETGWDIELLNQDLSTLDADLSGFNVDFDFVADELLKMEATSESESVDGEDDVPENIKTICECGQKWILGDHILVCGDSTKYEDVKKLMGGGMADILITDPPYNVNYEGKGEDRLKIENDEMNDDDFKNFLTLVFKNADSFMRKGAVFYVWHADSEGFNFRASAKEAGWRIRQCLVWNKNSLVLGRQDYHWKHEPCLYGWKDGAPHVWNSDRSQTTVLDFDRPTKNKEHPTMKPVNLIEYQIKNSSMPGDVVLDLFGGSGTTLIASEKTKRKCRILELDPKYASVIIKRWEDFTGQKAILESDA